MNSTLIYRTHIGVGIESEPTQKRRKVDFWNSRTYNYNEGVTPLSNKKRPLTQHPNARDVGPAPFCKNKRVKTLLPPHSKRKAAKRMMMVHVKDDTPPMFNYSYHKQDTPHSGTHFLDNDKFQEMSTDVPLGMQYAFL